MPLPENKTPFKTMDIKTALLAASNRKRKATSPTLHANSPKHIKTSDDKKLISEPSEDEIEIIEPDNDMVAIGDCKENTDCNVLKNEQNTLSNEISCSLQIVHKDCVKPESLQDLNQFSCDDNSFRSSGGELNSSNLNNSLSAQNISESSDSTEKDSKSETTSPLGVQNAVAGGSENKLSDLTVSNQNVTKPKRKKKMSFEEAKKRSEERERKRRESLKKKEELNAEKLQKKLEKEKQKEQEKIEKERLKREKKEQEEKEKQQKLKEKEEQKKQRQIMLEMKQEEKKKKEEIKLKREAELKKAEEEKLKAKLEKEQREKEKQERKERNKAAFLKFFVSKTTTSPAAPQKPVEEGVFKPFQVSDDMTLAPVVPLAAQERFNREYLDHVLKVQDSKELYLQILKSGNYEDVRLRKRQRRQRLGDADVIIMDNIEPSELFLTAKLLQFCENVRPPYWGTWTKRSTKIRPRNPFGEDEIFDYTVDSDDEWDEGGPGESLSGTENEIESEDDYEVDNEFFVPHGYLSAEEEDEEEDVENDPEKQKALLKLKQQEFEKERKKKTTELKPIILGCYFENVPEFQDPGLNNFLQAYTSEILCDTTIPTRFTVQKLKAEAKLHSNTSSPSRGSASARKKVPEEAMPDLIRLVHGNVNGIRILKKEFQVFWLQRCKAGSLPEEAPVEKKEPMTVDLQSTPSKPKVSPEVSSTNSGFISKRQLTLLIREISTYGKCPNANMKKSCWYVHDSVREKYGVLDAPIPNVWNYLTSKDEADISPVAKSNSIKHILKQQSQVINTQ